jgi:predicted porin
MKKKLLTLAVAAAVAAPALASAEAIMYGKLNMSIDYQDIDTRITPWFNASARSAVDISYVDPATNTVVTVPGATYPGEIIFVSPNGDRSGVTQAIDPTTGQPVPLNQAQANLVRGMQAVMPNGFSGSQGYKGWALNRGPNLRGEGRANRLGVKGSEDLGNGLKAVYQIELGINMANESDNNLVNGDRSANSSPISMRNTYVGLAGNWGTALIGRHDTPFKLSSGKLDLFADTMADYNGTVGFHDLRADNAIAYVSPSWSGFQLMAAVVPGGGATATGDFNINSDSIGEGYSLAALYSNGPFYASAAYEVLGEELWMDTETSLNGCFVDSSTYPAAVGLGTITEQSYRCDKANDDNTKYRLGLGMLDWNGFTLTGIYEHQDFATSDNWYSISGPVLLNGQPISGLSWNLPSGSDSVDRWQIQAGYSFGNFMFKGMYGQASFDGSYSLPNWGQMGLASQAGVLSEAYDNIYNNSLETWAIGADYNFSKRTKAYVLYTETTQDTSGTPRIYGAGLPATPVLATSNGASQSDWSGFSLGVMHSF